MARIIIKKTGAQTLARVPGLTEHSAPVKNLYQQKGMGTNDLIFILMIFSMLTGLGLIELSAYPEAELSETGRLVMKLTGYILFLPLVLGVLYAAHTIRLSNRQMTERKLQKEKHEHIKGSE